jgi:hypothetical protein
MEKKVHHSQKTHAVQCWLNFLLSIVMIMGVFASIVVNLVSNPNELVQEVGLKTFRMFTDLSNMFVGITSAMTIPFAVDGIRQKNYHLPRWIMNLTLASVTAVSVTFATALLALAPRAGFVRIMLTSTNLMMHTVVPLLAMLSFLFVNTYHTITFKATIFAVIPVALYAACYFVMAVLIGEENGGWRDHYHFLELMPWYRMLAIVLLLTFGLANLLRFVHNRMHQRDKAATAAYYQNAAAYDMPTIEEAITKLARENKRHDTGGEVIVPRRIITMLEEKYESKKDMGYLCGIYLEEYLK